MSHAADSLIEAQLAAALRGACLHTPPRSDWPALMREAGAHGVLPLLADAATAARWDEDILATLRPIVAAETALAMLREAELRRVLAALAATGVEPLIIKGGHLAYAFYRSPGRRPRLDTDLLIRDADKPALTRCLISLGYSPVPHVTGEVAFSQFQYQRVDDHGASHTLDIHWRIAIPKAFADRLTYDDLRQSAVHVAALGPNAFVPSASLALLVACLHRTAHHGTTTRLVWLYDIHLLAGSLSALDWEAVVDRARQCGLTPVVAAGLEDAAERFGTSVPQRMLERLHDGDAATEPDVLAFLRGTPPRIQVAASDWRRIHGVRNRMRFLQEHLFPPASYMWHRYGVSSRGALPFLYVHRAVTGAVKWLKESP